MPKPKSQDHVKPSFQMSATGTQAELSITGEIGWWETSGDRFIKLVDQLLAQGVMDIHAYINTPGGSMFDANEIGNQISRFTGSKSCKLGSICASAGTTLLTYFDYDKIRGSDNTQLMIHDPISKPLITRVKDWDSNKQLYLNLRDQAIKDYVRLTTANKGDEAPKAEEIDQMMESVTWMNATEAKAKGFIYSVSGEKDDYMPEDTAAVLKNIYAELSQKPGSKLQIPQMINLLIDSSTEDDDINKDTNQDTNTDMDEKLLKNRLIVAFALSSVTESSTLEDVVNAALQVNKGHVELMNSITKALGLSVSVDDEADAVIKAFTDMVKAKDDKIAEFQQSQEIDQKNKLKAVLDISEKQGKSTPKQRASLEALAENSGLDKLIEFLETVPARKKITDQIDDDAIPEGEGLESAVYARMAEIQAKQTAH